MDLWARDPELKGVSFSFNYPNYGNWTFATGDEVIVQAPGVIKNLNPFMTSSYYDKLAINDKDDIKKEKQKSAQ